MDPEDEVEAEAEASSEEEEEPASREVHSPSAAAEPAAGEIAAQADADEEEEEAESEAPIPLLMLDAASFQSKGQNFFSEAPPPSPEKASRHRRWRPVVDRDGVHDDVYTRSAMELEVEELLDNSTNWRKAAQPRIRTPVRRAVLAYSSAGRHDGLRRRQQVLCDLNAKVRELEVAALSRGIACSLATAAQQRQQREGQPLAAADGSKLDPRVQIAYQVVAATQLQKTSQQDAAARAAPMLYAGPPRLQSRGYPAVRRAPLSRERTAATAATASVAAATSSGGSNGAGHRPRRTKSSLTAATPAVDNGAYRSVTRADLLKLQSVNGEVQRSLYTERTPCLRRLLHAGDAQQRGGQTGGDFCAASLQAVSASLMTKRARDLAAAQ